MSNGAAAVDETTNVLLSALHSGWDFTNQTITYAFMPGGTSYSASYGGTGVAETVTGAEQTWAAGEFAEISNVSSLTFTQVTYTDNPMITLIKEPNIGDPGVAGYATYPVGNEAEIVVESQWWGDYGVLVHEIGHALGIKHPFEDNPTLPGVNSTNDPGDFGLNSELYTMMAYRDPVAYENGTLDLPNQENVATLDIAYLQALYGTNTTYRTGDDTYGKNSELYAIWDADGADAIDYSSASADAVIDLRAATLKSESGGAGFLSYVLDGERFDGTPYTDGGYTIAYGVTIESGIGGSGDDMITGNTADNTLDGNAGSDTIDGGDGNDIISGAIGDDSLTGGAGNDSITGADLSDSIIERDMAELNDASVTNRALEVSSFSGMPGSITLDFAVRLETGVSGKQWLVSYSSANDEPTLDLVVWDDTPGRVWVVEKTTANANGGNSYTARSTQLTKSELADGETHRLTVSRDATTGEMKIYLDGILKDTDTVDAGEAYGSGGDLAFGTNLSGVFAASARDPDVALRGAIGEVRLYDSVLSDVEIAALGDAPLTDTSDSRLTSYWAGDGSASQSSFTDAKGGSALALTNVATVTQEPLDTDNDVISGGSGNDSIDGRIGNDTITGDDGDDIVLGGVGDDSLSGGADHDRLDGFTGMDSLDGGTGNDTLNGGLDDDMLFGGAGTNILRGQGGDDSLVAGDDADELMGGIGNDTIEGGAGADLILGQGDIDIIYGGAGNDDLRGGSADDVLYGGADDDEILGQGNNDILFGDGGNDLLRGAAGADSLYGGAGNDTLYGGNGTDYLDGGSGNDLMNAGGQIDTFFFAAGYGSDTISGFGNNADLIRFSADLFDPLTYPSGPTAQQVIDNFTSVAGTGTDFTFDNGEKLRVLGVAAAELLDDIEIV